MWFGSSWRVRDGDIGRTFLHRSQDNIVATVGIQSVKMMNLNVGYFFSTQVQRSPLSPEIILSRMASYSMTSPSPRGEFLAFDLSGGF